MAELELLRFLTAGSVDDGKSTLIGRLLHDAKGIYEDQMESIRREPVAGRVNGVDFSLLTDGLLAEREQGITIDVAYRYFSTERRKFIIADTPGHEQYTRNMATGASTASLAVLLMDVRKGILPQTCRHMVIAWLLGIRAFAVAVNKMDTVQFREEPFRQVVKDFTQFASRLGCPKPFFVPTCSLDGDNIARRSTRTPWFDEPSLLEHLETIPIPVNSSGNVLRLPVQFVLRPPGGSRRYAGQIASGAVQPGDPVLVLPAGLTTRITSIRVGEEEFESASSPLAVTVTLEDDIDVGRGDVLVDPRRPPVARHRIRATLLWMNAQPLRTSHPYLIKHTTRYVCATIARVCALIDPTTLERRPAEALALNEFGEVEVELRQALIFDPYSENRVTGAFIVVEPLSNETVATGMIEGDSVSESGERLKIEQTAGLGLTVWFTGLSSAGKSTICQALYEKLWAQGHKVEWLDGDAVRRHLSKGLGFSKEDRDENVRRIGFVAELLTRNGVIVLVSAISPYAAVRDEIRKRIGNFLEVFVHAPLDVCEQRDLKGIYRRARAGEIRNVTGVDDPYEAPTAPEVECRTDREAVAESVAKVLSAIQHMLRLPTDQL